MGVGSEALPVPDDLLDEEFLGAGFLLRTYPFPSTFQDGCPWEKQDGIC